MNSAFNTNLESLLLGVSNISKNPGLEDNVNDQTEQCDNAEKSSIVLKTSATKCRVCKIGDVLPDPKNTKGEGKFIIYTRNGTFSGSHQTFRCNNFTHPFQAGHFYGYVSCGENNNQTKCYEKFALKNEYLVTSSQTAFSVEYLYDCTLQILHSNASFESLAKISCDLYFSNLPSDVMQ